LLVEHAGVHGEANLRGALAERLVDRGERPVRPPICVGLN
jgi:hypothetical protein